MPADYVELSFWQLALAAGLVLVSGAISLVLELGLERRLLVAAVRTVVQLLLIGLVLRWIFGQPWYVVLALMFAMTTIAGVAAVRRTEHRWRGIWLDSLISMWASSWLIATVALLGIVQVQPWDRPHWPQYAIPLLGMILGNTLNGISLGLDRLSGELAARRDEVDTLLALGATRWEAARAPIQQAVRTAMIPTINTMMVVGLVTLPGMMTGQLLAMADPVQAAAYQIVILFVIAAATSLGCVGAVLLSYRRLFTAEHQFVPERLTKRG